MSEMTEKLFARFGAIYGNRWTASLTTEEAINLAILEWSSIVERLTEAQLVAGITWAKTSSPWPPSVAEFLHAALDIDELEIRKKAICLSARAGMACGTYKEIDQAVRVGRKRAIQALVEEGLQPALEHQEPRLLAIGA